MKKRQNHVKEDELCNWKDVNGELMSDRDECNGGT